MRENEEKERAKILKSHEEGQKLRIIKEDSKPEVSVPSQAQGPSSVSVPRRSQQKISSKFSDFQKERKKAVSELKQRIEEQVRIVFRLLIKGGFDKQITSQ